MMLASLLAAAFLPIPPDLVVAQDGSGTFTTVQAAVASVPAGNRERVIILVKNGTYHEKVRIDANDVTVVGESRDGTKIEFAQSANDARRARDGLGQAVVNVNGNDCVLQNLTIANTQPQVGIHAFAVFGKGDRTVITDANIWSQGNDTLSLWANDGRYYHARLDVKGSVDFVCPRGWCYLADSTLHEVNPLPSGDAQVWHDGSRNQDMKFVIERCRFDGVPGWRLARHHHDAAFYFLDCRFSDTMRDLAPKRVIYPLNGGNPSPADIENNRQHDPSNIWGEREYYHDCHRDGGDYGWFANNVAGTKQMTAAWTFDGKWNPERTDPPEIRSITRTPAGWVVTFSENVTVKGHPQLPLKSGESATYRSGSGTAELRFAAAQGPAEDGVILASEADATLRVVTRTLPVAGLR